LPKLKKSRSLRRNFQQSLEETSEEEQDKVNSIKSMCLDVADVLSPLKENLKALAKNG
jgi:hypothetical protein